MACGLWLNLCIYHAGERTVALGPLVISSVSSLSFLFLFLPCPSFSSPLLSLLSLFSLSLGDDTKWPTRIVVLLNPNTIKSIREDTTLFDTTIASLEGILPCLIIFSEGILHYLIVSSEMILHYLIVSKSEGILHYLIFSAEGILQYLH